MTLTTGPSPQPKIMPYLTIIPSRRPEQKIHSNIGHAKNAITGKIGGYGRGAECDMELHEWIDGEWQLRYTVKQGEKVAPWQVEDLKKQAEKREKAERELTAKLEASDRKQASLEAKFYYENVIGKPVGESFDLFAEGYVEGYVSAKRGI